MNYPPPKEVGISTQFLLNLSFIDQKKLLHNSHHKQGNAMKTPLKSKTLDNITSHYCATKQQLNTEIKGLLMPLYKQHE